MNNNLKKSEDIHAINRLTFMSLITGFLLNILFQVALIPKNGKTLILNGLFFSLLVITLLFLFVFLLFLIVSFEESKGIINSNIIEKTRELARNLLYVGLFSFNVFLHYLIRLFLYPDDGKIIALVFTIIYSTCLIIILFVLQAIWRTDRKYLEFGIPWIILSVILISVPIFF